MGSRGGLADPHDEVEGNPSAAGPCARQSVTINFEEIGWRHILAPKQVSSAQSVLRGESEPSLTVDRLPLLCWSLRPPHCGTQGLHNLCRLCCLREF